MSKAITIYCRSLITEIENLFNHSLFEERSLVVNLTSNLLIY